MPSKEFALPGHGEGPKGRGAGAYPIDTKNRARNALARGAQHASPSELATIRRKVKAKYPDIDVSKARGGKIGLWAGSGTGEGRLIKERAERRGRLRGGMVGQTAGSKSGEGRIEKAISMRRHRGPPVKGVIG
jgi:hypothetical protein